MRWFLRLIIAASCAACSGASGAAERLDELGLGDIERLNTTRADMLDFLQLDQRKVELDRSTAGSIVITIDSRFVSTVAYAEAPPEVDASCALVYHAGHEPTVFGDAPIQALAQSVRAQGCGFWFVSMPLNGVNAASGDADRAALHDELANLRSARASNP